MWVYLDYSGTDPRHLNGNIYNLHTNLNNNNDNNNNDKSSKSLYI